MNSEPFASLGLRELADIWEKQLAEPGSRDEIQDRRSRLLDLYVQILSADEEPAVRRDMATRILTLHEAAPVEAKILDAAAEIANDRGDTETCLRLLDALAHDEDAEMKANALEKLGDLFAERGDRRAAVESWKPAARMRESRPPSDHEHLRQLYERVLDMLPDDDAAERLVRLHAEASRWDRIAEPLGVLVRSDAARAAELVLELEDAAWRAGALAPFLSMVDEAAALLSPSSETTRRLRRAQACALAADPRRHDEASATFRALLETFEREDDRRDFQAFVGLMKDDERRRAEQRWIHRWVRSVVRRSADDVAFDLSTLIAAALDDAEEIVVWDAAERIARAGGEVGPVARAYADALARGARDAALAEILGRRMIALEAECVLDAPVVVAALEEVLEVSPCARWALDRVKLALGAQARWDALFATYDRALDATADERERIELLDEAAVAARDLAGDAARAIDYFAALHALAPDQLGAVTALERLYERLDRKQDLAALLSGRAARCAGAQRTELRRRVVTLLLELGKIEDASAELEAMLEAATVRQLEDLLRQVAAHTGPWRATEHLSAYYEGAGDLAEAVRVLEAALGVDPDPRRSAQRMREIVRLRIAAEQARATVFASAATSLEVHVARHPELGKVAYRALLVRALSASRRAQTDAALADALDGAWRSVDALKTSLVDAGDPLAASRLLERAARLRFEPARQRALLHDAARLCAEPRRALRLMTEIFQEDCTDAIASSLFGRFATLLDDAGEHAKLARLWEARGRHHAQIDDHREARACWLRAAALWELHQAWNEAVAAHEWAAELGAEASYEALARIHAKHGRWTSAIRALEWLCDRSCGDARARRALRLADAHLELGESQEARIRLEQVLESAPSEEIVREAHARLAPIYGRVAARHRELGDVKGAARLLERALGFDAKDLGLRPQLAEALEALGEWERVGDVLSEQLSLYGERRSKERALVHHKLATALVRTNRAPEALPHLEIAAKMHPTHPAILEDLARASLRADDLETAEKTYRALLLAIRRPSEPCPGLSYARVCVELGSIAARKGDAERAAALLESGLDAAEEALQSLADGEPPSAALQAALASLCERSELQARLAPLLERAIATMPAGRDRARLRVTLAKTTLAQPGKESAAIELLSGARAEDPSLGPDVTWQLADALTRAKRRSEATRLYESLLDQAPNDVGAARALAERLEALGSPRLADCLELCIRLDVAAAPTLAPQLLALRDEQWDDAGILRALEIGLAAAPEDRAILCRLVDAYRASGAEEEALRLLDGALARSADDLELLTLRARAQDPLAIPFALRLVDALLRNRRTDDAARELERLLARDPAHAGALERLAALEAGRGAWDRAAEIYARWLGVLEGADGDPAVVARAAIALAEACERDGRAEDAREPLERAIERSPAHADLVARLERVCRAAGDWARVAELLSARCEKMTDAREKSAAELELALLRAKAQLSRGDAREALRPLQEVVWQNRGKRSSLLARVHLEMAKAHLALDELPEALDVLKSGFAMDFRIGELAMLLGLVALDLGDEKTAERALTGAATLPSTSHTEKAVALYHLAAMADAHGDAAKARRWAAKALHEDSGHTGAIALVYRLDRTEPQPRYARAR